MFIQLSFI